MTTEKRIAELVESHGRRRVLGAPLGRAALWCGWAVVAAVVVFCSVQPFREGFFAHLLSNPLLLVEILSAGLLVWSSAVWAFQSAVPGERVSKWARGVFAAAAAVFAAATALSFTRLGAEPTAHGGRATCWLEVIVCGAVTFAVLVALLRRGYPRFGAFQTWMLAFGAMLPAGALMQLACAYNPMHGLLFHYAPMFVMSIAALAVQRLLRR